MSSDLRSIRFQFFLRICKRRDASQNCRAVFFMPSAVRSRQKSTDFFVRHGTKRGRHTVNGGGGRSVLGGGAAYFNRRNRFIRKKYGVFFPEYGVLSALLRRKFFC